jgi:hypothetical protein
MTMWSKALLIVSLLSFSPVLAQDDSTPEVSPVVERCRQLMSADAPTFTGPDAPTIHIVQPAPTGTVYGEQVSVTVVTQNFELEPEGRHWHLWVNGQLQQMVYGPTALINLAPGTHEICALMGDANHFDLGTPDGVMVTIAAAASGTPTATPAVAPEVAASYSTIESQLTALMLIGVAVVGLIVAGAGWYIGARLPKRRR